ncbi:MAG TPA: STAS domain-containing protein [Gaiellales bacterium]|jgi:anti-sigma B factor antagonist
MSDAAGSLELELRPAGEPAFDAILRLRGEHDLASADELETAIATVRGSILVDLSGCEFLDSSVLRVLFDKHAALRPAGHHVELIAPRENLAVTRILELSGLGEVFPLRD